MWKFAFFLFDAVGTTQCVGFCPSKSLGKSVHFMCSFYVCILDYCLLLNSSFKWSWVIIVHWFFSGFTSFCSPHDSIMLEVRWYKQPSKRLFSNMRLANKHFWYILLKKLNRKKGRRKTRMSWQKLVPHIVSDSRGGKQANVHASLAT